MNNKELKLSTLPEVVVGVAGGVGVARMARLRGADVELVGDSAGGVDTWTPHRPGQGLLHF